MSGLGWAHREARKRDARNLFWAALVGIVLLVLGWVAVVRGWDLAPIVAVAVLVALVSVAVKQARFGWGE